MADRIQLRRGTAAQCSAVNPTLLSGEIMCETDTGKLKVGDGITAWNSQGYLGGSTNATDLISGTLADARLSANVLLAASTTATMGATSVAMKTAEVGTTKIYVSDANAITGVGAEGAFDGPKVGWGISAQHNYANLVLGANKNPNIHLRAHDNPSGRKVWEVTQNTDGGFEINTIGDTLDPANVGGTYNVLTHVNIIHPDHTNSEYPARMAVLGGVASKSLTAYVGSADSNNDKPLLRLWDSYGDSNEKIWELALESDGTLQINSVTDNQATAYRAMAFPRSGGLNDYVWIRSIQMGGTNESSAVAGIRANNISGVDYVEIWNANQTRGNVAAARGFFSTTVQINQRVGIGTAADSSRALDIYQNQAAATVRIQADSNTWNRSTIQSLAGNGNTTIQVVGCNAEGSSFQKSDVLQIDTAKSAWFVWAIGNTSGFQGSDSYSINRIRQNGTRETVLELDSSTTAGDTRMLVFDVDSGTLKRVSVGAADSGGTGYRVLRVPN